MVSLKSSKPKVKSLASRGDLDGLIDAVYYEDRRPDWGGEATDLGAPVREGAVRALAEVGPELAGIAVSDALRDSSDRVRLAAVRVLTIWGDSVMLARAVGWLPADEGQSRPLALAALEQLAMPGSAEALAQALVYAHDDEPLRSGDVASLFRLLAAEDRPGYPDGLIGVLVTALGEQREAVGQRAADLLTRLGPASIEAVTTALRDSGVPRAAHVLGGIGDLAAVEALTETLTHPDASVRAASCSALGELRSPAPAEALLRATGDADPAVRSSAGAALDQIGTAGMIVAIAALLRPAVKKAAAAPKRRASTATRSRQKPTGQTAKRHASGDNGATSAQHNGTGEVE